MVNTREVATEYRLSHWAQIVRERAESGISIRAYFVDIPCKEIGICENTYFYWQRRLRKAACEQLGKYEAEEKSARPCFVEVEVAEQRVLPALPAPSLPAPSPSQLQIKVAGVQITVDSAYPREQLVALLRELRRPC